MAFMHHNELRVNAIAPDDDEVMKIWHEVGWRRGPHKDTDPDHPAYLGEIPFVLPESELEQEPTKATKADTKKG